MFTKKNNDSWLIVGLGNPGKQYENTRHNCGFLALDVLGEKLNCKIDRSKFQGFYGQAQYNGTKIYLLKPMTYMNLSGRSLLQLSAYFSIPSLPVGKLRIRGDGSAGGHNGIKSIIAELGSQDFPRIKIGVGAKAHPEQDLADWVLSSFSKEESKLLQTALERGADAALTIIDKGVPAAANSYNGL